MLQQVDRLVIEVVDLVVVQRAWRLAALIARVAAVRRRVVSHHFRQDGSTDTDTKLVELVLFLRQVKRVQLKPEIERHQSKLLETFSKQEKPQKVFRCCLSYQLIDDGHNAHQHPSGHSQKTSRTEETTMQVSTYHFHFYIYHRLSDDKDFVK